MEYGNRVAGMEGLMGASGEGLGAGGVTGAGVDGMFSSPLVYPSGHLKHGRSGGPEDDEWRSLKMARSEAMSKAAPFHRSNSFSDGGQMLSFSSSSEGAFPYYHYPSSSTASYVRNNAGFSSGSSNASMHGVLAGVKGPFTPSQWMELEHQAMIYKYIDANIPIPSNLLLSIRRGLNPSGISAFSAGSLRPNTLGVGWGSLNLGFTGSVDLEPGRCRRTDGKKWRCSRDAVAEQKYCERHMNRGRHRSRKLVEGHGGHAAKVMPIVAPSQAASAVSGGRSTNSLSITRQQMKSLQPNVTDSSLAQHNRILPSKENGIDHLRDPQGLSMLSSVNSKTTSTLFPMSKQHNTFEGSSCGTDFGLFSSNSFLNPHTENISFDRQPESNTLRHFMDDLPKEQSDRSSITWPEVEEVQCDRTQLSISIPMASSDFSSSSSSPNREKPTVSPLRLAREFDPIPMGLGVGGVMSEVNQRQANWVPISWDTTVGGPLGEVLANTNNTSKDHSKNCSSSSLNLLTDGWDSSPRLRSSPTGVLQKTTFGSVSSSAGSSPRAGNHKAHDSTSSLCEDLLGSTLANPSTIPLL